MTPVFAVEFALGQEADGVVRSSRSASDSLLAVAVDDAVNVRQGELVNLLERPLYQIDSRYGKNGN